ncbi:MAG: cache domain-containing protein [bacterium]|nr:cache domain-containing protein [bacterium]
MWTIFWLNNSHFALEFFGAIILFVLAWLALDSYLIKKEFKTLARSLGFLFFAFWLIVNSLNITNDLILSLAVFSYLLGLSLIFLNLYWEKAAPRPEFKIVLVLPAVAGVLWWFHIPATILLFLIAILALRRYQAESLKALKPFWMAFFALVVASVLAIFNAKTVDRGPLFILEHIFKLIGFGLLGYWGWQYLKLRIKEEMLLIFVGMALFISVIVTSTFSAILLKNMEEDAKANLISNVRVLNYTLLRMEKESLSNAQLFAKDGEIQDGLSKKDFAKLEEKSQQLMAGKSMDFLTIANETGEVILRAHSATSKGDSIKEEKAGGEALAGNSYATIESTLTESLSIRGAAPIYGLKNNIIGVVVTGFIIDSALADQIKKNTGLEATVYEGDTVQATTIFDPDGRTRNVGAKQTDSNVINKVLKDGQGVVGRTTIFSSPYLAAYFPLKNTEGAIIGMIQASRPQTEIVDTAASANRLTLLVTMIIVVITSMPAYMISKKIVEEI